MKNIFRELYVKSTGYSYTHMGRLFLRLFIGLMLMQFGLRQLYNFSEAAASFPPTLGMDAETSLIVMIIIEIGCSFFIMAGFCTRVMVIPPFLAMIFAEHYLLTHSAAEATYMITWMEPGYVPMLFMGIYFFILLVGPGKISVDYFLSLYLLHADNASEAELEEV